MDSHLTRRSLLAGGAGVLAAGLTRVPPAASAAQGAAPQTRLSTLDLGAVPAGGSTIDLPAGADLLGLSWAGQPGAHIRLRFRGAGGRWSPWVSAGSRGHDQEGARPGGESVGEPIWTGGASAVQVLPHEPLGDARLHLVDVSAGAGARSGALEASAAALALAGPALASGAGQPPIIARRSWAQGVSPPRVAPEYGSVRMAFVHHTENPNGYAAGEVPAMLRAIYAFHTYTNGWNDIGYNFVIDLYGRIFEARAGGITEAVTGAHAGGYNYVSTGVSVLGTFSSVPISAAAKHALQSLLAWKLPLHGVPALGNVAVRVNPAGAQYSKYRANARVVLPHIAGHRDGDSTECPGDVLYGELPSIRPVVARMAGTIARLTIALGAPLAPPPAPPSPEAGGGAAAPTTTETSPAQPAQRTVEGTLTLLSTGAPVAGASVIVQSRSVSRRGEAVKESTLAEAQTGPQGQWSAVVPVPATGTLALRALCPGAHPLGASVSEGLTLHAEKTAV